MLDDNQIKAIQEATGHSVFGASSLPRIVSCPASVGMELKAGLQPESIYAAKGTELHDYTEKALRSTNVSKYVHSLPLSIEDMSYVLDAVDYVLAVESSHKGDLVVPQPTESGKYDMAEVHSLVKNGKTVMLLEASGSLASYGVPESYGTGDVIIISLARVDVIDHKFGHGVAVYAKENKQLVAYLGMAVPFAEIPDTSRELYVHINQPTKNIYDEWRVEWDVFYQIILGDISDAVALAKTESPPYGPSTSACRFCNANKGCKERYNKLTSQANMIRKMANNPSEVPNEKWAQFLEAADALTSAISDIRKHAVVEIQKGNDFGNFKLVAGRSTRKIVDKDKYREFIASRFGKKGFKDPEVVSLSQAEKMDRSLKDDSDWLELLHKPEGAPKLVKADAKGEALVYGVGGLMQSMARGEV